MIFIGLGIKKVEILRDVRFDKEVLWKLTVSTSTSLEIDELHDSSQESSSIADKDERSEESRNFNKSKERTSR